MNLDIITYYENMENNIHLDIDNVYGPLVHPLDTQHFDVHNWYRFKEGFSPNLLKEVLGFFGLEKDIRLLDPFCGSGTTILSSMLLDKNYQFDSATGVEVNPFIHFVASTKVKYGNLNITASVDFLNNLKNIEINEYLTEINIPELSTIPKAFSYNTLSQIINLRALIEDTFFGSYEEDFFKLALAAIIEQVSCMKKSGRALKIIRKVAEYDVKQIFIQKANQMIKECELLKSTLSEGLMPNIINTDIRNLNSDKEKDYFNLVVFSPPYLNHFDYTEVYKLELWMLGFVSSKKEFRDLRYKTFRSHPSVKFEETDIYKSHNSENIKNLIHYLESLEEKEPFYTTIIGYIDDMYKTLKKLYKTSTNNASFACIVANSLFGSSKKNNLTPVATDLIISEIAKDLGFEIICIKVARKLTRRGIIFPYGRESVIYFKKVTE
ncbi:hypothetical protein D3C75_677570 [compost metagenome]